MSEISCLHVSFQCCSLDSPDVLFLWKVLCLCFCSFAVACMWFLLSFWRDFWVCSTSHKMHMNSLLNQWSKYWEIQILFQLFFIYIAFLTHISWIVYLPRGSDLDDLYLYVTCRFTQKYVGDKVTWHWTEKPQLCHLSWAVCAVLHCLMSVSHIHHGTHCMCSIITSPVCAVQFVFSSALFWNRKTFAQQPAFLNMFKDGVSEECPVTCPPRLTHPVQDTV